jgi:hypothetical protein
MLLPEKLRELKPDPRRAGADGRPSLDRLPRGGHTGAHEHPQPTPTQIFRFRRAVADPALTAAARIAIRDSLAVKAGEKVLIVTNPDPDVSASPGPSTTPPLTR